MLLEFVVSTGYGALSAILPLFNAEIYLAAAQVSGLGAVVTTALGLAVGTTIGKTAIVVGLRRGSQLAFIQRQRAKAQRPVGPFREKIRRRGEQLLALLGDHRYGIPIVFLSSVLGIPPLFAVTLAVPATKMHAGWFALTVLVGRSIFFLAIAFGISRLVRP